MVSEPLRPKPSVAIRRELREHSGEAAISAPVGPELRYGYARLPRSRRRDAIERYIEDGVFASLPVLRYDQQAADWHALERSRLREDGRTPPFVDGQIAAITYVNGLLLVTSNLGHFRGFNGIQIESWE